MNIKQLQTSWTGLTNQIPLRPIRTKEDFTAIKSLADQLCDEVGDNENHPLFSLFDVVMVLIQNWEENHVVIPDVEPREVLRYLLNQHNLLQKDLTDIASESLISDILNGRRNISIKMAKKLAKRFHVNASVFL